MHNIFYVKQPRNLTKSDMIRVAVNYSREGDGYCSNLTLHENKIYDSRDQAQEAINGFDNGWYDDHAVLFRDLDSVKESREIINIKERLKKTQVAKTEYIRANPVTNRSSEFIGCKNCGSKLSRTHLRANNCPLCGNDLRSPTVLSRIKAYDAKIDKLQSELTAAKLRQKDNADVCWLQKIEYHS